MPQKPSHVESSKRRSAIWDALCSCYEFRDCDAYALAMLCEWYVVAERCHELLDAGDDSVRVVVTDADGNQALHKALAALQMSQASIAALNKQLGIEPGSKAIEPKRESTVIGNVFDGGRRRKAVGV